MTKPLVVFTYAPAGLGHIRVAEALTEGLPADVEYVVFAPFDTGLESAHRFSSLHIFARKIMVWSQSGWPEEIFTRFYRKFLIHSAGGLVNQFVSLITSRTEKPKEILVVSTHFGLGHQLGAVKDRLEKLLNAKIRLVVQVTDDSPQRMWYVENADLIVCPSKYTKNELEKYAKKADLKKVELVVLPYPVAPSFAKTLSNSKLENRLDQYNPEKDNPINIAIPVSGAAVGMRFFLHLMKALHAKSNRFVFHVVCRKAPFTVNFLHRVSHLHYVKLYVSKTYPETIHLYDSVYCQNVISAEVTKPSEQTFKALLKPNSVGGAVLFFAEPVGRQEFDNIDFLKRHNLPAIQLPFGSKQSAQVIWDYYSSPTKRSPGNHSAEVADNGVELFWQKLLGASCSTTTLW